MNLKCGYFTVGGIMCGSLVGMLLVPSVASFLGAEGELLSNCIL